MTGVVMMIQVFAAAVAGLFAASPLWAENYSPVRDKGQFLQLLEGRELRIGAYDLSLKVLPDGRIAGSALGTEVAGEWAWKDGYFCRKMMWGKREIPYNCQLVEALGDGAMRFTVDQGRGMSAAFRLR